MTFWPGAVGKIIITRINIFSGILSLLYYSFLRLGKTDRKGRWYFHDILVKQIYFTGVQAGTIIGFIALVIGIAIIPILNNFLAGIGLGLEQYLGQVLELVVIRTVGPLLTAVIIIARSGTAIATEIGNMVMNHEIEALETMGIDTLYFIVLPRILAMAASLIVLNLYFTVVCIAGGIGVAWLLGNDISIAGLMSNFLDRLSLMVFAEAILKAVFFGFGISVICIINGFKAGFFKGGVPVAGINAVVGSLMYVFVINSVLTVLFLVKF